MKISPNERATLKTPLRVRVPWDKNGGIFKFEQKTMEKFK